MSVQQVSEGVFYRDHTQSLKVYTTPLDYQYNSPRIQPIALDVAKSYLGLSNVSSSSGRHLLQQLRHLYAPATKLFALKEDAVSSLVFKLCWKGNELLTTQNLPRFTALSYVCHSSQWKPHPACLNSDSVNNDCPMTALMWMAFMEEIEDDTPFWVDALCITQDNGPEKQAAISAMDYIYKSAAKIIVALEDVALTEHEVTALETCSRSSAGMGECSEEELSAISSAFTKILNARWFQRAWCVHEFNLGKRYVFLISIELPEHVTESSQFLYRRVLRIDSCLLVRVSYTFIQLEYENRRRGNYSSEPTVNFEQRQSYNVLRFVSRLKHIDMAEVFGSDTVSSDNSYVQTFSEIFSLGSLFVSDRLAILLNIMDCGLSYQGYMDVDEEKCFELVALLALAAGDATMLCANGRPLHLEVDALSKSLGWVRMAGSGDMISPPGLLAMPKMDGNIVLNKSGLEIDVVVVATPDDLRPPAQRFCSLARLLIDHRYLLVDSTDEPFVNLDHEEDEKKYPDLRLYYIQALACTLELGSQWLVNYGSNVGFNLPGVNQGWSENLTKAYQNGVDWALSIRLEDDIGFNMVEEWKDESDAIFSGKAELQHQLFDTTDHDTWIGLNGDQRHGYSKLLQFVDELVTTGLAVDVTQQHSGIDDGRYTIQILEFPSGAFVSPSKGSSTPSLACGIVHLPVCSSTTYLPDSLKLCLPVPLLKPSYQFMARTWLVARSTEPSEAAHQLEVYRLVTKTRVAGIIPFVESVEKQDVDRIILN